MAMTYAEIIAEADERYPNALDNTSKLRKIYNHENILCRTIYRKKTATVFDIVKDQFLYDLGFNPSNVISLIWNGDRVDYEEIDADESVEPYYYTYETSIGRYPTPDQDVSGGLLVFHYATPTKPTITNMDIYPAFDNDFPMLQVYKLVVEMAQIDQRADMVNTYTTMYNDELEAFNNAKREPVVKDIKVR